MGRLSNILYAAFGDGEKAEKAKRMLAHEYEGQKEVYRYLSNEEVEAISGKDARELILSSSVARSGLVQIEIYNTVVKGARKRVCMREALPMVKMDTDTMRVPYGTADNYAPKTEAGSEFPPLYQKYAYKTLQAETYGNQIPISKALYEDAKFDLLEIEFEKAGKNIENSLNRVGLTELLDGSGLEWDTQGSNQGISALIRAKTLVDAGFNADTIIMHPRAWGMVFSDWKPAYNETAEQTLRNGVMPPILGMKAHVTNVAEDSATYNWNYQADNDIGMLVLDAAASGLIGMRKDITVEMNEDVVKMLINPVVYARFDAVSLNPDAICRVKF